MNGIDASWDPASDPWLPPELRYSADDALEGKARAKASVQARLGLDLDPTAALFVSVGRLTSQKGVDVLLASLPRLFLHLDREKTDPAAAREDAIAAHVQIAILGAGEVRADALGACLYRGSGLLVDGSSYTYICT